MFRISHGIPILFSLLVLGALTQSSWYNTNPMSDTEDWLIVLYLLILLILEGCSMFVKKYEFKFLTALLLWLFGGVFVQSYLQGEFGLFNGLILLFVIIYAVELDFRYNDNSKEK